jgi:hypothetical protein
MRQTFTLLILLLCSATIYAQRNGVVRGTLTDTLNHVSVADATVTVMNRKDSSLVSFGMTDNSGKFEINNLPMGEYRLLFTHVAFHNTSVFFKLTAEQRTAEMGRIVMHDRTKVLDEIIIRQESAPVTMIGDTIQYHAPAFRTPPNASVEDLLKKLPGIEVAKDGSIKAQGQDIKRVLVDGKEFFGTDPKMATKNLPADAIEKVQLYDRMSDQAQLTGFDDGNSEKTLNLKLKADRKKGSFGKIMGGGGTDERFEGRFNLNSFKGPRQMSVLGLTNNTNKEGFSFMDLMNFSGDLSRMLQGGGSFTMSGSDPNAELLRSMGNTNVGVRTIWGGGVNYNNLIGKKAELTSNYFYNGFNPLTYSDISRQYLLPDSTYFYNRSSRTDNSYETHRLNLGIDYQIDSFHSVKISPSIGYQRNNLDSWSSYTQSGEDGRISNQGTTLSGQTGSNFNFNNEALFRKRFRKRGRTFSLLVQTSLSNGNSDGDLKINNRFFDRSGNPAGQQLADQQIFTDNTLSGYTARAVYTEPVGLYSLMEWSISQGKTKNRSEKTTYDYSTASGKYDDLNDSLTNDFTNRYGYVNAGVRWRTQKRKFNYFIGANWQQASLEGEIMTVKDSVIRKSFTNILPTARLQYKFTNNKYIILYYRTSTNQPTVNQLQPVPDISNPLNVREGNPDLRQEYNHTLQVNYNAISTFKGKSFFAALNATRVDNKIVNADTLQSNGVKRTRPVNVNGVYNLMGNVSYGMPLGFVKGRIRTGASMLYNRGRQFINGQGNVISMFNAAPRVTLDFDISDKINWNVSAAVNYTRTGYSLQPALDNQFLSQDYETELNVELPLNFRFATDFTYRINNQRAAGFNAKVPLWGASLSKLFLKGQRGELKFTANDILNRNLGINRTTVQNFIEDSRVNTVRRYFMLSFTYSLSKVGLGQPSGIRIR